MARTTKPVKALTSPTPPLPLLIPPFPSLPSPDTSGTRNFTPINNNDPTKKAVRKHSVTFILSPKIKNPTLQNPLGAFLFPSPLPSAPASSSPQKVERKGEERVGKQLRLPSPQPQVPLSWLWTCHLCHCSYALAVTRRCLHDGHFFCAGQQPVVSSFVRRGISSSRGISSCGTRSLLGLGDRGWEGDVLGFAGAKRVKRVRRARKRVKSGACNSSFDYGGWRAWGEWRRGENDFGGEGVIKVGKSCWEDCDFPSECVHRPRPGMGG